jgi:uncharacterized damage-inducible protein DinB
MPTWPAPERPEPPYAGDERATLEAFLDFQRETLLLKCAGLTGEQLVARSVPPSTMSLLGLVRHMADVERSWFVDRWQGKAEAIYWTREDRDADFNDVDPARADEDREIYLGMVAAARDEAARHSLDDTMAYPRRDDVPMEISLRWIYTHMIEEYARHNGHADLLRERIDGATGE